MQVTFQDIIEYADEHHAVYAGREIGSYTLPTGQKTRLAIRTTRYFRYVSPGRTWLQWHHHGSIDDAAALSAYQNAISGVQAR